MKKPSFWGFLLGALCLVAFFSACSSNDDTSPEPGDSFYSGALTNANLTLLQQYWSIFEVNYEKTSADVPHIYGNCDRDFFTFLNNGMYREYIIPNSGCIPEEQQLTWDFDQGVITLQNSFKDFNEMVIVELTANTFIFKAKYDIDEDGEDDILQFLAKAYTPNENYFYSNNITRDESVSNKIVLNWSEYNGINNFLKYEIYLSEENCDLSRATLLATIDDRSNTFFEDLDPPLKNQLCYFLKVYTDKGLLFESYAYSVSPEFIEVPGVSLAQPVVQNGKITLEWEKYDGLYFSHYEVVVKNYIDGYGLFYQEKSLIKISDINSTSFTDVTPPYVKNPVYEIRVYNKLDRQNYYNPQVVTSVQEAIYLPEQVIDLQNVYHLASSPDETVVFLNGDRESYYDTYLMRYNYVTKMVEAISDSRTQLNGDLKNKLKFVQSSAGQELLFLKYDGIAVYNPLTLGYKYNLIISEISSLEDFIYLGDDRYLLLDDTYAYTVSRDFANLTLIDKQEHFANSQSQNMFHVLKIDNSRVLIGNTDENQSVVFEISSEGFLMNKSTLDISVTGVLSGESVYNPHDNTLVNFRENRIYNLATSNYSSFEQPFYPVSLNPNGTKILGTNNDPQWNIEPNSLHKKEARILELLSSNVSAANTEGYPHFLFENHLGQIISLSTYFKRQKARDSYERPDFFVEIVPQ